MTVRNNPLRTEQTMTAADYVDRARGWARTLEEEQAKGSTLERARHDLEAKYGIPANIFWSLRHRPPKTIAAHLYHGLMAAYQRELERQRRRYGEELEETRRIQAGTDSKLVRAAVAVAGEAVGADEATE